MKRIICILLSLALAVGVFAGCGGSSQSSGKIKIVTTVFPQYDWVREIIGDNSDRFELTLLIDKGVDLHSFQPTADDIVEISSCDMFIFVGGASDEWTKDALKNTVNKNVKVIDLMKTLGSAAKEEEVVEGMQAEEEEEGEIEYDEHIWLSLKNAASLCRVIGDGIKELDSENADAYENNLTAYTEKLNTLDGEYQAAVDEAPQKTLLFGDRFPFRYLTDDYGIKYYAAFVGCSAESEASFETVSFLAKKVDELGLKSVIALEGSDKKLAKTIIKNTQNADGISILQLNSIQSVTMKEVNAGTTYLNIMENNLTVLKEALK